MTLNPDIVRDVLIYLEEKLEFNAIDGNKISEKTISDELSIIKGYEKDNTIYVVHTLFENKFIEASPRYGRNKRYTGCDVYNISLKGHNLLGNIKDDRIWNEVKSKANAARIESIESLSEICRIVVGNTMSKVIASIKEESKSGV